MAKFLSEPEAYNLCETEEERAILDSMNPATSALCFYKAQGLSNSKAFELVYGRQIDRASASRHISKALREDEGSKLYTRLCHRATLQTSIDIYNDVEKALHQIATGKTVREEVHKVRDGSSERLVRAEVTPEFSDRVTAGKTLLDNKFRMEQLTQVQSSGQVQINFGGFGDGD